MKEFLQARIELAKYLAENVRGAHYADVVLILTAVISACASRRWPGTGIDRKRFVELLVRYSPPHFHTSWISLPDLLGDYPDALIRPPGIPDTSIRCGEDVDKDYREAEGSFSDYRPEQIRKDSYATLIYERHRCGSAHEYWAGGNNVTHVPPSSQKARVTYIARGTPRGFRRMLAFHLEYLIDLSAHHAANLPEEACKEPPTWWIDGG